MQGINPPSEVYAELVRASLSVKDEIRAHQVLDTVEANEQKVGEVRPNTLSVFSVLC